MNAVTVFAILYSKIKGIATGMKSVTYDSTTQSLNFICQDGTVFTVALPYPLTNTEIQWVKDLSTTLEINTITNDLEYNGEILNNIVFEQVKGSFPSVGNEKKLYIEISTDSLYRWDTTTNDYVKLGAGVAVEKYQEEITIPSSTWTIQHNLSTIYPSKVYVFDEDDNEIMFPNIEYFSANVLKVKFDLPIKGKILIIK